MRRHRRVCTTRRWSCARMTNTNYSRHVAVGTTKKSAATIWRAWFARNALYIGLASDLLQFHPVKSARWKIEADDAPVANEPELSRSVASKEFELRNELVASFHRLAADREENVAGVQAGVARDRAPS